MISIKVKIYYSVYHDLGLYLQILSSPRGLDEQARSDSTQDLSFGLNTSLGSLSNKFAFDAVVRPRSGSEDLSKDVLYGRDSAILPNKPGFNLGEWYQQLSARLWYLQCICTGDTTVLD